MKRKTAFILFFIVPVVLCFCGFYVNDYLVRKDLKSKCGPGMDCACFTNIVDNRLNHNQIRIFSKFLESIRIRPLTNILEYTDEKSARDIFTIISICRHQDSINTNKGIK